MKQSLKEFGKWDFQHHIHPSFYEEGARKGGYDKIYGVDYPKWSEKMMLGWMDKVNIEKALMTISAPGVHFGDDAEARALARKCNDYMAELIARHPGCLGGFASIPLPDVDGAINELKYALDTLPLDGIHLLSNMNYIYLGDKRLEPFWEEADKRETVVYIHPASPEIGKSQYILNYVYYMKLDTTRTIMDFVRSGYHKKFKKVKFVLGHGGGVLPAVFPSMIAELEREQPGIKKEFEEFRSRIFADTALIAYPDETMPTTMNFYGANHLVYGSDLCYATMNFKYFIGELSKLNVPKEMLEKIYNKNAKALFGQKSVPYKPFSIKPESSKREKAALNYHAHCNPKTVADFVKNKTGMELKDVQICSGEDSFGATDFLSMDIPQLWSMDQADIRKALEMYNDKMALTRKDSEGPGGVLAAVDSDDVKFSISEIDRCLMTLKMDGICLYLNIGGKPNKDIIHKDLLKKLETVNVPVVIHPKDTTGVPIFNENYFDSVAYLFRLIYEDYFEHMKRVNYIPTHTSGLLDFLSHPVNSMHYVDPVKHEVRTGKVVWELLIKKQEVVHDYIKNLKYIY